MKTNGILSISEVNALPVENFEWLFANIIEHTPESAKVVAEKRPFRSKRHLKLAYCEYLDNLDNYDKEQILLKHPDLAGKMAEEGKLTNESENEQQSAGLHDMTSQEKTSLCNNNALYKEKFCFPFIICARENKIQSILNGIEIRLKNTRDVEIKNAIEEIKKICHLRIDDIVWPDE